MAKKRISTIDSKMDKRLFFSEQLYSQLENMFTWSGLPDSVPSDYLERTLVRYGYLMYYYDDNIGEDILRASPFGYNRHDLPTQATAQLIDSLGNKHAYIERNIKRLSDGIGVEFNKEKDCILITNTFYGDSCADIVNHYVNRLILAQEAFDTSLYWSKIPYIFLTDSDDKRLSIEKMFSDVDDGKPFVISDKNLFVDNKDQGGVPTNIPFISKDLIDVINEIYMQFRQAVGIETAGVDKAERVNTLEVKSNNQFTQTILEKMYSQRKKAADEINTFFGGNVEVTLTGQPTDDGLFKIGDDNDGNDDDGAEELTQD